MGAVGRLLWSSHKWIPVCRSRFKNIPREALKFLPPITSDPRVQKSAASRGEETEKSRRLEAAAEGQGDVSDVSCDLFKGLSDG